MTNMRIESYRDLEVWQKGRRLASQVYQMTRQFPEEERYGLISQLRRAAVSVPSNIAEGWARRYPAEFVQFLRKANGSLAEVETQLLLAMDVGYLKEETISPILAECGVLGKQILTLERRIREVKRER